MAVTPNGYADAPNSGYFVMPEERLMKFGSFLDVMECPDSQPGVRSGLVMESCFVIMECY